ncbi:MAG: DUF2065 domain-containing protein [Rhodobacteraceae bacterium]|nr:DUF2065 domain-containing protein [Paracoccaceae bacterium]
MEEFVLALGLVAVIEGLVLVLAPRRMEDVLRSIAQISVEARRIVGLVAVAVGVFIVWVARSFLA